MWQLNKIYLTIYFYLNLLPQHFGHTLNELGRVVRFNRTANVAQIGEKFNAGSHRQVSEHTVHFCFGS